jgi:hypothetical protein
MNKLSVKFDDNYTQQDFYRQIRDKNWLTSFMKEHNITGWPAAYIVDGVGYFSW